MSVNNHDKGLPSTPSVGVRLDVQAPEGGGENLIPIFTNNFNADVPKNPIFWGPNQPWTDINTYTKPQNWRAKELLSIPRVARMVVAISDPCDHTAGHDGDFVCNFITLGDGFWLLHTTSSQWMGMILSGQVYCFALNTSLFQVGAINLLYSGDFPPPSPPGCPGAAGTINVYGDDGMGDLKATVTIDGITYGDEV